MHGKISQNEDKKCTRKIKDNNINKNKNYDYIDSFFDLHWLKCFKETIKKYLEFKFKSHKVLMFFFFF